MKNFLIYTTRALSGSESKNVMSHIEILKKYQNVNIDLLARNTTNISGTHLFEYTGIQVTKVINSVIKYYYDEGHKLKDWVEFYHNIDVTEFEKYDKIFIFGGLDLPSANLNRQKKRVGVFPNDGDNISFVSTGRQVSNIIAILKAHHLYNIEIHELSYDPNELCCALMHKDYRPNEKYYNYHGYDIPRYNMKRLDTLQYALSNRYQFFPEEKLYDISFGYTSMNGERRKFENYVNDVYSLFDPAISNLYVRDKKKNVNTLIDKDLYLTKIEQSRYTLILPAYNESCFSIYRLIESLYKDCLPIISPDCNIDEVEKSFNCSLKDLVDYKPSSESDRMECINHYKKIFLTFEKEFEF